MWYEKKFTLKAAKKEDKNEREHNSKKCKEENYWYED